MTPAQARIIAVLGLLVSMVAVTTALVFYLGDRETGTVRSAAARPTVVVSAVPTATAPSSPHPGTEPPSSPPSRTVTATPTPRPAGAISVRATSAVNVRNGPGTQYDVIGVLQPPDEARVTGRNADASWLAIEHAGGTGWVSAGVVEVVGDPLRAPLVEPALPRTATPAPPAPPTATASPVPTRAVPTSPAIPLATATPAAALPDLVPLAASVNADGRVTVTIGNTGQGPLTGRSVSIVGVDAAGSVLFSQLTAPLTIAPGAAVTVELAYRPPEPVTVTIVLNAEGSVPESNANNNLLRVTLTPR